MIFSFHFLGGKRAEYHKRIMCISLPLVYLVCILTSLAYYKELITAARV